MFASILRATRIMRALGAGLILSLASSYAAPAATVTAPQFAVGDHWRYRITDNLRRGAVSELDVEVTSVTGGAAQIRIQRTDPSGRTEWVDEIDGQGGLRAGSLNHEPPRPFNPPAQMLAFPLDNGKTWRQTIDTMRKDTGIKDQILIYGKVKGSANVTVAAGRFDTVSIYRTVQLDDSEFWRSRTLRTDSVWYAPAVKAPVREKREAYYSQRDRGMAQVRTESTVLDLLSFQPGAK